MKKYWYAEGVGGEAWMEDEPSKYVESGPYYLASEVDPLVDSLIKANHSKHDELMRLSRDAGSADGEPK